MTNEINYLWSSKVSRRDLPKHLAAAGLLFETIIQVACSSNLSEEDAVSQAVLLDRNFIEDKTIISRFIEFSKGFPELLVEYRPPGVKIHYDSRIPIPNLLSVIGFKSIYFQDSFDQPFQGAVELDMETREEPFLNRKYENKNSPAGFMISFDKNGGYIGADCTEDFHHTNPYIDVRRIGSIELGFPLTFEEIAEKDTIFVFNSGLLTNMPNSPTIIPIRFKFVTKKPGILA